MYEKLGHDIEYARYRAGYQSELTRLAKSGLGLRSPSMLESALNNFLEGLTGDGTTGVIQAGGKKIRKYVPKMLKYMSPFGYVMSNMFGEWSKD